MMSQNSARKLLFPGEQAITPTSKFLSPSKTQPVISRNTTHSSSFLYSRWTLAFRPGSAVRRIVSGPLTGFGWIAQSLRGLATTELELAIFRTCQVCTLDTQFHRRIRHRLWSTSLHSPESWFQLDRMLLYSFHVTYIGDVVRMSRGE